MWTAPTAPTKPAPTTVPAPSDPANARSPPSTRPGLAEYDAAPRGQRGAIPRCEGRYDTRLIHWRRTAAGAANALGPRKPDPRDREIAELRARAEADLDGPERDWRSWEKQTSSCRSFPRARTRPSRRSVDQPAVDELADVLPGRLGGIRRACDLLGRARTSHSRQMPSRWLEPSPGAADQRSERSRGTARPGRADLGAGRGQVRRPALGSSASLDLS
jgi:hypothetical protein